MKSVGLFFGTFDPIHKGHEAIADFFLLNFFDEVWFVVTPMNPDKIEKGTSDENIRLEMIEQFCKLNKKFKFIRSNTNLLDLGSCPGGWSQVAVKIITTGKIMSIDIKDMEPIKNVKFLKGDINKIETKSTIIHYFKSN